MFRYRSPAPAAGKGCQLLSDPMGGGLEAAVGCSVVSGYFYPTLRTGNWPGGCTASDCLRMSPDFWDNNNFSRVGRIQQRTRFKTDLLRTTANLQWPARRGGNLCPG